MLSENRYMHQQVLAHVVALPLLRCRGHNSHRRPNLRHMDLSRLVSCQVSLSLSLSRALSLSLSLSLSITLSEAVLCIRIVWQHC
jgi:hypothetical protein